MAGTYTKLIYHIIFSTKNREPLIMSVANIIDVKTADSDQLI